MKQFIFLLFLETSFFLSVFSQNSNVLVASSSQAYLNEPVKDEPNIIKGWLRFFTFVTDFYTKDMPTKFEYNPAYLAQFSFDRHPSFTDKDKDEYGYFNIPTDTHFFFVLTTKTLYVINARRVNIRVLKKYRLFFFRMTSLKPTRALKFLGCTQKKLTVFNKLKAFFIYFFKSL